MFVRNCWYVAAWPGELTGRPLARTLLGEPVVLYRQSDGQVVALQDRCAHRAVPLSMGELCEDRLICPYHGLAYDRTGACVHVPEQDKIPSGARVRSFPLVDRDGAVWIWMGDPERADPDKIVPYPWHVDAGWAHKTGYNHIEGHYQLLNDNLLDLSHITWVHRKTIGGSAATQVKAELRTERDGDVVTVRRYLMDSPPPPTYVRAVGFEGRIDRWMKIECFPGLLRIYTGANDAGKGVDEANQADHFGARIFNGITPETEHTTHYFWSAAHNFKVDQPAVTQAFFDEVAATFLEDKVIMEAQYKRLRQFPAYRSIDIRSDAGGIQARRVLSALAENEGGASKAS
ncbi:Rieske 2Fe-2S domain-containing protein [Methylibium sp.]|uniref:Rieske 2Fe-2S domain-containing protein n=1 Tax=Methylibium sp. TaxID=2067992 RepID=UPI003D0F8170